MKRKNFIKGVALTTSIAVLGSTFAPLSTAFAEETNHPIENISKDVQVTVETPDSLIEYIEEEKELQEEALGEELTTKEFLSDEVSMEAQDTRDFIQYATTTDEFKAFVGEDVSSSQVDTAEASGIVGGILKGIKAFGWICRVGGKSLKYAIKPLSPSKAKLVDQYARKIAYATEKLDKGTKGALTAALKKAGVPGKSAESLTEIIFWLI